MPSNAMANPFIFLGKIMKLKRNESYLQKNESDTRMKVAHEASSVVFQILKMGFEGLGTNKKELFLVFALLFIYKNVHTYHTHACMHAYTNTHAHIHTYIHTRELSKSVCCAQERKR